MHNGLRDTSTLQSTVNNSLTPGSAANIVTPYTALLIIDFQTIKAQSVGAHVTFNL